MNNQSIPSLAGGNKIWKLSIIALTLLSVILFFGCGDNSTAPSEIPALSSNLESLGPESLGQGGFWMPNGKQHKEGCGCNICNAIRINLEEFCLPDTVTDSVTIIDTVIVVDTVEIGIALEGEWLRFSAYQASKGFVKENYPERANDRFSSNSAFCNYASYPAGRAGFKFVDNGDGTYVTEGYTYEYLFGAIGFVWGAAQGQPTEKTYNYGCTLQLGEDDNWTLLNIGLGPCGDYIRDTRHD